MTSTSDEKPAALWEDFLEIFISPAAVFARRTDAGFGAALAVLTVLLVVLFYLVLPAVEPLFDAEFNRQIAKALQENPQLKPEQLEGMRSFGTRFGGVSLLVGMPLTVLFVAGVVKLASGLAGAPLEYGNAAMITTYSFFPRVLEQLTNAAQGLLLPESAMTSRFSVSLGVGRFLDADTMSPVLLALLGRIDLFTLWVTALIGIGVATVTKLPRPTAFAVAGIVWLAGAIPTVLQALR